MSEFIMPISKKFRGERISEIPDYFLEWCIAKVTNYPEVVYQCDLELKRRADELKETKFAKPGVVPTADQQNAINKIAWWLEFGANTVCKLGGLAGTGKTTIMGFVIDIAHANGMNVKVATPTGRAASVLNSKLPKNIAYTIHKHALKLRGTKLSGRLDHKGRPLSEPEFDRDSAFSAEVLIVDEASMLDKDNFEFLASRTSYLLCVGDHGQLPPVGDEELSPAMQQLDYELTDIRRQDADSPIIKLSRIVREGHELQGYGLVPEIQMKNIHHAVELAKQADAGFIITSLNKTRHAFNVASRDLLGYPRDSDPRIDEPLLITSNSYKAGMFNGELWNVTECHLLSDEFEEGMVYLCQLDNGLTGLANEREFCVIGHDWRTDKVLNMSMAASKKFDPYAVRTTRRAVEIRDILEKHPSIHEAINEYGFAATNFGYALTGHKSQGSQADNVVIINERPVGDRRFWPNWRYTVVTRAAKNLTLIQP